MVEEPDLYLPDECWESIFTFLNHAADDGEDNQRYMEPVSVVSKVNSSSPSAIIFDSHSLYMLLR
jgi:hypothetical protein